MYSGAFFVFFAITHWSSLFLFEHEIPHYQSAEIVMDKSTSSRIAIISDTHGYLDERIAVVVTGCDYVLHAGDVGGAGIIKKLKPRSKAIVVQGNNDVPEKWTKEELPILETLPMEAYLDLPGGRIVVVHAISPDSNYIASAGDDKTVRLWYRDGYPLGNPFEGHTGPIYAVAFSPDGQYIVTGGNDKTVRLWDAGGWQSWLSAACDRLSAHSVLLEPQDEVARNAVRTCLTIDN